MLAAAAAFLAIAWSNAGKSWWKRLSMLKRGSDADVTNWVRCKLRPLSW